MRGKALDVKHWKVLHVITHTVFICGQTTNHHTSSISDWGFTCSNYSDLHLYVSPKLYLISYLSMAQLKTEPV